MAYPSLDRLAGHADGQAGDIPTLLGPVASTHKQLQSEALDMWLDELEQANAPEGCRVPAERLLRIVFGDRRTRWDEIAILPRQNVWDRLAELRPVWRMCPGWVRWLVCRRMMEEPRGRVDYWRVEGDPPEIPRRLDPDQRRVLEALLAHGPLWSLRTNLWQLFGLPGDRRRLSAWIRAHRY